MEKGMEKGRLLGKQETVLLLLEDRFGPLAPSVRSHIETLPYETLSQMTRKIVKAQSLEELGLEQE